MIRIRDRKRGDTAACDTANDEPAENVGPTAFEDQAALTTDTNGDESAQSPTGDGGAAADTSVNPEPLGHDVSRRQPRWRGAVVYAVLPLLIVVLAGVAGYLKWFDASGRDAQSVGVETVQVATESAIKMLSYQPDTVEADLNAARDRLTGSFKDSYTQLTNDVVIPGSKQKHISAVANVAAASSISATPNHAVVMLFVNQTTVVGDDPPTNTASVVKVTLDKQNRRWLVADLTPI